MDLKIEMEANRGTVKAMYLLMTYQFSPTICRKGVFRLPIVAADAPPSIVTLLLSFHAVPPHPILSEQQKQEAVKQKVLPAAIMSSARVNDMDTVGVRASNGANAALQQPLATNAITGAVNPVLLKKRRALAGTMYVTIESLIRVQHR